MAKRASIPKSIEADILLRSGRRCCVCVGLSGDTGVKPGQIAHIDRDASNNEESNLAFLCLEHHDQYDSRTSQSKGFTEGELRSYRDALYARLPSLVSGADKEGSGTSLAGKYPSCNGQAAPNAQERQIYTELWNRLFEFRIAAHELVDSLQDRVHQDAHGKFNDTLNGYQAVVRRNEPFIFPPIFEAARAIASEGRRIAAATGALAELQEQRGKCQDLAADERIAEKMIEVDEKQQEAVEEIDRLFNEVRNRIQNRTMPPLDGSSS